MIDFKKQYFVLGLTIVLAIFLRFYQLGQNPPSLTWDEVAWGYNAYSLGIDGKDEFGRFLPYDYLESFGDFKPPVYAYLDILPVKLFGLNEFSVRFPSAFLGVLTVLVTYFLVRRIFCESPLKDSYALISSFLLAISPWHINLSRAAFEANIATFFLVLSVFSFLAGIQGKKYYLIFSVVSFVLSIYTFNSARAVAPILILGLVLGCRKQLLKQRQEIIRAIIVLVLLILPTLQFFLSPQASLRFKEVNIFSDLTVIERTNKEIENDNNAWWSRVLHNRRFAYTIEYLRHYFDNLNPSFLFIRGDGNPKFSTQDVGQLYLIELSFLIIGAFLLFRLREGYWWVLPLWLVVGILPAATARETPHALRIEVILPTFQIITAYGFIYSMRILSNIKVKYLIYGLIFLFLLFNFLYYYHGYYAHYPKIFSGEWQYGYKESIAFVKSVEDEYDEIRITNKLGRPYVYYLFYTKTDPKIFRKTARIKRDVFGFVTVDGFSKYRFSESLGSIKSNARRVLYIDIPERVPGRVEVLSNFYLLNGERVLVAYRKQ